MRSSNMLDLENNSGKTKLGDLGKSNFRMLNLAKGAPPLFIVSVCVCVCVCVGV